MGGMTTEIQEDSVKIRNALSPLFKEFLEKGYSIDSITAEMGATVFELMAVHNIEYSRKKYKELKEKGS